jgi:hypothetical protein
MKLCFCSLVYFHFPYCLSFALSLFCLTLAIPFLSLALGCNILGLGFIFAIQYLIEVPRFGPPPLLPSNFFILGVLIIAAVLLLFYNGEYKRLKHEKLENLSGNSFILDSSQNGESLLTIVDSTTTHHPFASVSSSHNNKNSKYHPPNPSTSSSLNKGGVGGVLDDSAIVRVTDGTFSQDQSMVNSSLVNNSMTMWVSE